MKTFLNVYFFLFLLIGISACQTVKKTAEITPSDEVVYEAAIQDGMHVTGSKVYDNLVDINKRNKNLIWKTINGEDYLLVVTWKQKVSYYKPFIDSLFYNTQDYPIWVTTTPELLNRIRGEKTTGVNRRLIELLGLPPNATYSYFVEFWVRPEDLFRPCPDKEITDSKCEICFPDKVDTEHINWINKSRVERYYACKLYKKYPWTQLGYTYDWNLNNKTHVGLSEFVIGKNKEIVVKGIYATEEYLMK